MPKIKKVFSFIIFTLYLLFTFFIPRASQAYEEVLFEDDFNAPNSSMWTVPRNTCIDSWEFSNGKYGMIISSGRCLSESSPSDEHWDSSWNDYTIDLDMEIVSGVNQNIAWRYWPTVPARWIDIQVAFGNIIFQGATETNRSNTFKITPGKYHFTIKAIGEIQKVFYYNVLNPTIIGYMEGTANGANRLLGRPALQVSDGAGVRTEVWFDNIRVTREVEVDALDVPYFSQIDPEWKDEIYGNTDKSIGYLGCTLTSSAMLLRYHGIDTIPGTSDTVTPLTLNNWLVNNDGYDPNGRLVYNRLSGLATQYISENPGSFSHSSMEVNSVGLPLQNIYDYLDDSINIEEYPLMVKLKSPTSPSNNHFVVGNGVLETDLSYSILDPIDVNNEISNIPPDKYRMAIGLTPSNSDQSYLVIHTDESLRFSIKDPINNENENIERSIFGIDYPATNYLEPDDLSIPTIWEFMQKYPNFGKYTISLEVDRNDFYNVWLMSTDKDGVYFLYNKWLYLMSDYPTTLHLTNDPSDSANSEIHVEYGYMEQDPIIEVLDNMYEDGYIKNKGILRSLKNHIKVYFKFIEKRPRISFFSLDLFIKRISFFSPKFLDEKAKEVLLTIADQLR